MTDGFCSSLVCTSLYITVKRGSLLITMGNKFCSRRSDLHKLSSCFIWWMLTRFRSVLPVTIELSTTNNGSTQPTEFCSTTDRINMNCIKPPPLVWHKEIISTIWSMRDILWQSKEKRIFEMWDPINRTNYSSKPGSPPGALLTQQYMFPSSQYIENHSSYKYNRITTSYVVNQDVNHNKEISPTYIWWMTIMPE